MIFLIFIEFVITCDDPKDIALAFTALHHLVLFLLPFQLSDLQKGKKGKVLILGGPTPGDPSHVRSSDENTDQCFGQTCRIKL